MTTSSGPRTVQRGAEVEVCRSGPEPCCTFKAVGRLSRQVARPCVPTYVAPLSPTTPPVGAGTNQVLDQLPAHSFVYRRYRPAHPGHGRRAAPPAGSLAEPSAVGT